MVQSRFKIYLEEAGVKIVTPGVSKFCFKLKMFDVVDHFFLSNTQSWLSSSQVKICILTHIRVLELKTLKVYDLSTYSFRVATFEASHVQ